VFLQNSKGVCLFKLLSTETMPFMHGAQNFIKKDQDLNISTNPWGASTGHTSHAQSDVEKMVIIRKVFH
jgi:hypothetical protein